MNYVRYFQPSGHPVGTFEVRRVGNEWLEPKFNHDRTDHLISGEVAEFSKLIQSFFREFKTDSELRTFFRKHGKLISSDGYEQTYAVSSSGDVMDYVIHQSGELVLFFPYRKEF